MPEPEFDLVLDRRTPLADGVVALTLRGAGGEPLPEWEPGAHVDLLLADGLVRQYSLCGDPADRSELRVAVLREPDGRGGSAHVHDVVAEGDTVRVRGPRNHFPLVEARHYVFVAGGIGITPILPMVDAADAAGADWRLVYGGRTRASMAFLDQLTGRHPDRVAVFPQDETGPLDLPALLGGAGPDTRTYCCGPEGLLTAVEDLCADRPLHVERFCTPRSDMSGESFELELASSGRTLTVPADRSVLETLERSGVTVLSSCREGTCGTCETGVLDGVPEHRDTVLAPDERAANDVMMVCVSRSCSPRLVLDL
ncbi:MAG: PDR/VanB family oxidoreductase [Actinomycetota bacterium]|nr:PDR/VanB family oxidoreductase [Actinomycetota bacterium]